MRYIIIKDRWGRSRKASWIRCYLCKERFLKRIYSNRANKYCSRKCSARARTTSKIVCCLNCGKNYNRKLSRLDTNVLWFCSRKCKEEYQSQEKHPNWNGGKSTYRIRAIKKYGLYCSSGDKCPLKNIALPVFMLEVDHIDSNRSNNNLSNLQVLCVWCHRNKTYGE